MTAEASSISRLAAITYVCVIGATISSAPAAAEGGVGAMFPSASQMAHVYPLVVDRSVEGWNGQAAWLPSCADRQTPDRPLTKVGRWATYGLEDGAPRNALRPRLTFHSYSTEAKAERVMRQLRKHVEACLGVRDGSDVSTRFSEYRAERLGDEGLSLRTAEWWTIEGMQRTVARQVWVRTGKKVMSTEISRHRGKVDRGDAVRAAVAFNRSAG